MIEEGVEGDDSVQVVGMSMKDWFCDWEDSRVSTVSKPVGLLFSAWIYPINDLKSREESF